MCAKKSNKERRKGIERTACLYCMDDGLIMIFSPEASVNKQTLAVITWPLFKKAIGLIMQFKCLFYVAFNNIVRLEVFEIS